MLSGHQRAKHHITTSRARAAKMFFLAVSLFLTLHFSICVLSAPNPVALNYIFYDESLSKFCHLVGIDDEFKKKSSEQLNASIQVENLGPLKKVSLMYESFPDAGGLWYELLGSLVKVFMKESRLEIHANYFASVPS